MIVHEHSSVALIDSCFKCIIVVFPNFVREFSLFRKDISPDFCQLIILSFFTVCLTLLTQL